MSEGGIDLGNFAKVVEMLGRDSWTDPRLYLIAAVPPASMAAVLFFAFPRFVEYRDSIFLEMTFDQQVVDKWFDILGDPIRAELMANHIHLCDVVARDKNSEAESALLVGPLARGWGAALQYSFPNRSFDVIADPNGEYGPELSFSTSPRQRSMRQAKGIIGQW